MVPARSTKWLTIFYSGLRIKGDVEDIEALANLFGGADAIVSSKEMD